MLAPFQYEFFRHGFLAALLVGALCGLVGVYVVLRRMSYIGHGLAHALFGGAVLSSVVHVNFYIGAGIWALVAASLIHLIAYRRLVGADAAIGVVTTSSFAIGVAIVSTYRRFTRNIEAALFGNILGITRGDLLVIAVIALVVLVTILMIRRQLLFSTFDPEVAAAYGISTGWTDFYFVILLAVTVVASTKILGVTLVAAAIVIPPVIARYLTRSFHSLLVVSPLIGALCGGVGMLLSFYLDISSAAMIVLTSAALFLVVEINLLLRKGVAS
ncbi:MAG TPA: metal ABC transporter permease [Candidatus Binatia bacterium]